MKIHLNHFAVVCISFSPTLSSSSSLHQEVVSHDPTIWVPWILLLGTADWEGRGGENRYSSNSSVVIFQRHCESPKSYRPVNLSFLTSFSNNSWSKEMVLECIDGSSNEKQLGIWPSQKGLVWPGFTCSQELYRCTMCVGAGIRLGTSWLGLLVSSWCQTNVVDLWRV